MFCHRPRPVHLHLVAFTLPHSNSCGALVVAPPPMVKLNPRNPKLKQCMPTAVNSFLEFTGWDHTGMSSLTQYDCHGGLSVSRPFWEPTMTPWINNRKLKPTQTMLPPIPQPVEMEPSSQCSPRRAATILPWWFFPWLPLCLVFIRLWPLAECSATLTSAPQPHSLLIAFCRHTLPASQVSLSPTGHYLPFSELLP
jgi:hypothetical protein